MFLSSESPEINEPHKNDKLSTSKTHLQNKPLKRLDIKKLRLNIKANYEAL